VNFPFHPHYLKWSRDRCHPRNELDDDAQGHSEHLFPSSPSKFSRVWQGHVAPTCSGMPQSHVAPHCGEESRRNLCALRVSRCLSRGSARHATQEGH
jgi:hypothetical protein